MALFLSTYTNKVDAKGRVSVPAGFRTALQGQEFQGIVLLPSNKFQALEGFSMGMMHELSARIDKFDLFSDAQDDLAAVLFGNATPFAFDETGRIGLTKELLAHADIKENAVFVGMGNKFQIWSPEKYATRREAAMKEVHKKGLTVPNPGEGAK
jgi:MraZ protein